MVRARTSSRTVVEIVDLGLVNIRRRSVMPTAFCTPVNVVELMSDSAGERGEALQPLDPADLRL
jgi:hypothetical protein